MDPSTQARSIGREVAQQQRGHLQNALLASFDSRGCRILKNQLGQLCDDGSRHYPTNKAEIHNCVLPLTGMRRSWSMDKSQNLRHFDEDSGVASVFPLLAVQHVT